MTTAHYETSSSMYDTTRPYVFIQVCYHSIRKHILEANGLEDADVFIHSWSIELENQFKELYRPKMSEFEDNRVYDTFVGDSIRPPGTSVSWKEISYTISVQRAAMLMLQYENRVLREKNTYLNSQSSLYDRVLLVRPDIFIHKDLNLSKLEMKDDAMYCNSHGADAGDFHFVMNHRHAAGLASATYSNPVFQTVGAMHGRMRDFARYRLNATMRSDAQIFAGIHEDVIRKLKWENVLCNANEWWIKHMEEMYGMTEADWTALRRLEGRAIPKCVVKDPACLLDYCCTNGTCARQFKAQAKCPEACTPG